MKENNRQKIIRRVTWIGAFLDGVLAFVKVSVGFIVNSPALIADGFHSLSDLLTDIGVVVFSHWGQMEPDEEHPYGHHRYETLGTVILGTTLIVVASFIAWDSVVALIEKTHSPHPSVWAIAIAFVSIVSKEWIFRYTLKAAKKVKSKLMEANAWHSRSDAFSSIVVLIGVVATWFGFAWVELLAAIGVAILIGKMGVKLTWNATQDLVDRGIDVDDAKSMEATIRQTDGVVDVHMLRSRLMGNHVFLDVHIQVHPFASVSEGHYIAEKVLAVLKLEYDQVSDITVHVDYEEDVEGMENVTSILPDRNEIIMALSNYKVSVDRLQIHYSETDVILELLYFQKPENIELIRAYMAQLKNDMPWLKDYSVFFSLH